MADLNDRLAIALRVIFGHGEAPTVCGPHEIAVGLVPGEDLLLVEALERAAGLGRQSVSGASQPAMPEERVLWTTFGHAIVDLPDGEPLDVPVVLLDDPSRFADTVRAFVAELAERCADAARYPEGSKLRELAGEGLVTPARRSDPEAIQAMRAMVRAAAETPEEKP